MSISPSDEVLPIRVQFIAPVSLAGVRILGPYATSAKQAWSQVFDWLDARSHHAMPGRGYGLAWDDPRSVDAAQLRYDACVKVPATWNRIDEDFVSISRFVGGVYALQRWTGPYDLVGERISSIRQGGLTGLSLCLDPSRPVLTVFHDDPRTTAPEKLTGEIGIPVNPERRFEPRD